MKKNSLTQQLLNRHQLKALSERQDALQQWFGSEVGQTFLGEQQRMLNDQLETLFGYHLMQLSVLPDICLYDNSRAQHSFSIELVPSAASTGAVIAHEAHLPIENDALDIAIVHHLLDFSPSPHELLKEVQRVTRPGGHILIMGFNPLGALGAMSFFGNLSGHAFWNNRLLSARRLADWLTLLDLSVQQVNYGYYRLPIKTHLLRGVSSRLEQLLQKRQPSLGAGFYSLLAKNEYAALTPHKPRWHKQRPMMLSPSPYSPSKSSKTIH
ncbi:MAG: methyltransferase domain-containing protein [Pseudomonadales bacterium]|nr:methyltransferase domain-containing protein [Pseudomonadales bacterium]